MFEALELGYQFLNTLPSEIDALTLEEINSFIKEYLSIEKGIIIDVGPQIQPET
jgi:predicted Zn-dependent peptidase